MNNHHKNRKNGIKHHIDQLTDGGNLKSIVSFNPFLNKYISENICIEILRYIPLSDLTQRLCLVNKAWNKLIFDSGKLWENLVISNEQDFTICTNNYSSSSSVKWLEKCKIRSYIKDLNITPLCRLSYNAKILSKLSFPNLREFSFDSSHEEHESAEIYFKKFLECHQHILWINEEYFTPSQSKYVAITLEIIKNLKCLGVERIYLKEFLPINYYPNLECIGHFRIFDENFGLVEHLTTAFPNLKALSISIDTFPESLVNQLVKFKKLKVLYILFNTLGEYDVVESNNTVDSTILWLNLKHQIPSLKKILLCNITEKKIDEIKESLANSSVEVKLVNNGLPFWNEYDSLLNI